MLSSSMFHEEPGVNLIKNNDLASRIYGAVTVVSALSAASIPIRWLFHYDVHRPIKVLRDPSSDATPS